MNMHKDDTVRAYTDGSGDNKKRIGGWAFYAKWRDREIEYHGHAQDTTTNRMELTAIHALLTRIPPRRYPLVIHSDSMYAIQSLTVYCLKWLSNGWTKADGQPVTNPELLKAILALLERHRAVRRVTFNHVKGHSGVPGNERVDQRAGWASRNKATNVDFPLIIPEG